MWAISVLLHMAMSGETPRRRLLLHIGPHKTGSTTFQTYLSTHRRELASRGIGLVSTPLMRRHGVGPGFVAPWAAALRNETGVWYRRKGITLAMLAKEHNAIVAQLRRGGDLVMSCEELSILGPTAVNRVRAALRGFDVTVVAVYRDLVSRALSHATFNHDQVGTPLTLHKVIHDPTISSYRKILDLWRPVTLLPLWGPWPDGISQAILNTTFPHLTLGPPDETEHRRANQGSYHEAKASPGSEDPPGGGNTSCTMLTELMPLALQEYSDLIDDHRSPPPEFFQEMLLHLPFCYSTVRKPPPFATGELRKI